MPWRNLDQRVQQIVNAPNADAVIEIVHDHRALILRNSTLRIERIALAKAMITKLEQSLNMELVIRDTSEFDNIMLAVTLLEEYIASETIKSDYG